MAGAGRPRRQLRWPSAGFLGGEPRRATGRPVLPATQVADMTGGAARRRSASWPPCRRASAPAAASTWTSSLLAASLGAHDAARSRALLAGRRGRRRADAAPTPATRVYRCRDGRDLAVGALEPKFWERLCRALGLAELPRPAVGDGRARAARRIARLGRASSPSRDRDDWVRELAGRGRVRRAGAGAGEAPRVAAHGRAASAEQPAGGARCARWPRPSGSRGTPAAVPPAGARAWASTPTRCWPRPASRAARSRRCAATGCWREHGQPRPRRLPRSRQELGDGRRPRRSPSTCPARRSTPWAAG